MPRNDHLLGDREARPYGCPECAAEYATPAELAPHLERHRPLMEPRKIRRAPDVPCPKGCGRSFTSRQERTEHLVLCDGSPPFESVDAAAS